MTGKEVVRASLYFRTPDRYAFDFPERYGSDFYSCGMSPSPDDRASNSVDEWGCVWSTKTNTLLGEVHEHPLKSWDDLSTLKIPDFMEDRRWEKMKSARAEAGDKYLMSYICSIYERLHFLRGLEDLWCDIIENPDKVGFLIGVIVDRNIEAINRYADLGTDGIMIGDDWGLQNRLMISPEHWRAIWKPAYTRIFAAAHERGMDCWMHSCGYIVDILGDLIEVGLNAVHMDQQENMGLENLRDRFRGKINFFSCVDIQQTFARGSPGEIRAYTRKMAECLGTKAGGFIPRWYTDPVGAGHKEENITIMCDEFIKINKEVYGTDLPVKT
ncbi:MAG: hypothetical protein LBK83_00870 [Treponema sp.]|jgi:hypothetical protein|nr:hypothetical protein [Treponema sp.]